MKLHASDDMGRSVLAGDGDLLPSDYDGVKSSGRAKRDREMRAKKHDAYLRAMPWNDQKLSRKVTTHYKDLAPCAAAMLRTARAGIKDTDRLEHTSHMGGLNTQRSSRRDDVRMAADRADMHVHAGMVSARMEVVRGTPVSVRLESNRTTGFSWKVVSSTAASLGRVQGSYMAPSVGMMGAGGTEAFHFSTRGLRRGEHTVHMAYRRPWDPEDVARTFTLVLNVL
jgi:predicted secreted protein